MGASFIFLSPVQISVILCLPRNTPSTRKSILHLFEFHQGTSVAWQLFVTGAYFEMGGWV